MKHSRLRVGIAAALAVGLIVIVGAATPAGRARGITYDSLNPIQKRLVSGALAQALGPAGSSPMANAATATKCVNPTGGGDEADEAGNECPPDSYATPQSNGGGAANDPDYTPSGQNACSERLGDNVKVNQNCQNVTDPELAGRGQAQNEETIAIDPNNPDHMVASQNDYRRGDGNCYGEYSLDGGRHWNDSTVPIGFVDGSATWSTPREYWQGSGDTSVAWDTQGNAYLSCQAFNRGSSVSPDPDQSSAFYVFRSTGNNGASWNFVGPPVTEENDTAGAGSSLLDKNYLTVDDHVGSPYQDRIYESWTSFAADGTGYIYEAHSSDYGETFSAPVLVSGDSALCVNTYGLPTPQGRCNENQDSMPFTGPDGALYIAYDNFNNSVADDGDNHNQVLISRSTDGGASFSAPVLVSNYYDLPDCLTYQGSDPGRACVPEKGPSTNSVFRATNYPVGSVNPQNPRQIVVTFGSYINPDSNESNGCAPNGFNPDTGLNLYTGVKTAGSCNNDILISVSNDGGATFTGTTTDPRDEQTVDPDPSQALSDQFWQWQAFGDHGTLAVDYYDRQYGKPSLPAPSSSGKATPAAASAAAKAKGGLPADEYFGSSDITLAGSSNLTDWKTSRVTSSSMPAPTQFGGQFYGDYIGMDASGNKAAPIWSDTRDPELFLCPDGGPPKVCNGAYSTPTGDVLANDQNSYTAVDPIPSK